MLKEVPENFLDLLADETRAFAYLATVMKDGSPQVTPVWFNTDGEYILVNSAKGRVKDRNMRKRPQVALAIADPKNPYRYMQRARFGGGDHGAGCRRAHRCAGEEISAASTCTRVPGMTG